MKSVTKNELQRTMIVCVDSFDQGVPGGRLYGGKCECGKHFDNLMHLLTTMDQCLDENNFPQAFSKMRHFTQMQKKDARAADAEKIKEGAKATFSVRILFRQNASWQGYVTWLEGGGEESFRSALELIFLLNSALEGRTEQMKI